jgi:hypothetical protein
VSHLHVTVTNRILHSTSVPDVLAKIPDLPFLQFPSHVVFFESFCA